MKTSGNGWGWLVVVVGLLIAACTTQGAIRTWDGGGANALASNPTNWDGDVSAPAANDDIRLDSTTNKNMTWDLNIAVGAWTQVGYAGTVTVNTAYSGAFTNLTITGDCVISNGVWTQTANPAGSAESNRLYVSVGGNLTIGANGSIDVTGKGYTNGYGPGKGTGSYYGGSYGGRGGLYTTSDGVAGPTYGSVYAPTNLGSPGSSYGGGGGGGAVLLVVGGAVSNNGVIRANGATAAGFGTGSGGSIYLRAGSVAGSGTIEANGSGNVTHSTGGGGRISLVVTNSGAGFSNYSGPVTAFGGVATHTTRPPASPGTVYRETAADTPNRGELTVDANGVASTPDGGTVLNGKEAVTCEFSRIVVTNRGNLGIASINTLIVTNTAIVGASTNRTEGISVYGGTLTTPDSFAFSNFFIRIFTNAGASLAARSLTVGTNGTLIVDGPLSFSNDVVVRAGGLITHDATPAGSSEPYKVNLTVGGALTLDPGGNIDVTGRGFPALSGPGYGTGGYHGGSHGGPGGSYADPSYGVAGPTYGSLVAPTNLGSGGYADAGGGAVLLVVGGAVTNNGLISANGGGGAQGGAGGSVYLRVGTLAGSGNIQANGAGDSGNYAAGGGGRVSLVLTNSDASFDGYGGSVTAYGGARSSGNVPNGAGTVYLRTASQGTNEGTLILNSINSNVTRPTQISSNVTDTSVGSVLIRNYASLGLDANQSLTVGGVWSNSATLTGLSGTNGAAIVFGGSGVSTSAVYGNTRFWGLKCQTPGKTIQFAAGSSNTVVDALTLTGNASSNVVLRSTADGTQWKLNVAGTVVPSVRWVDVKDSDARPGTAVSALDSVGISQNNSNWVFVVLGQTNTWTGATNTAWGNSANWSLGATPLPTDDKAIIPAGCPNYPSLDANREINKLELASGASLRLNGFNLTVNDNATVAGSLTAAGSEQLLLKGGAVDFAGATVTPGSSTLLIGGGSAQTVNLAGKTFWNLLVTNVTGAVTLNGGCTARELRCDAGSGAQTVRFEAGATFNIRDLVTLGLSSATNIVFRSTGSPTRWKLNVTGYDMVKGTDVQDSDASGGKRIDPLYSKDSGNNTNWFFGTWSTWLGTNSTSFHAPGNWSPAGVPTAATAVLLETTNTMAVTSAVTVLKLTVGGGSGAAKATAQAPLTVIGGLTVRTNGTLAMNQPVTVSNDVFVTSGGLITHDANGTNEANKMELTVSGNLTLDVGASIDVTGKGYSTRKGPGNGTGSYYGGAYGGCGGLYTISDGASGPTYGSILAPTNLGSGGSAYAGGGAVLLFVNGAVTHNGAIRANGGSTGYGTGSGGSVYLRAGTFVGFGAIQANGGGNVTHSTGGGGRIALVLATPGAGFSNYSGPVTALGGVATEDRPLAGAGTVYRQDGSQLAGRGTVTIDNNALTNTARTHIPPATNAVPNELKRVSIVVTNRGAMAVTTNATVQALTVASTNEPLNLGTNGTVLTVSALSVNGTAYTRGGLYMTNNWNGYTPVPVNVTGAGAISLSDMQGTAFTFR